MMAAKKPRKKFHVHPHPKVKKGFKTHPKVKKGFKVHAHVHVKKGFHVHKKHAGVTVKKAEKPKAIVGLGYKKKPKRGPYSKGPSKWEQVPPSQGTLP